MSISGKKPVNIVIFLLLISIFSLITSFQNIVYASNYYPLVVYGGEPEGVAAAVSAAREGINTLLILKRDQPGGLMTYGGLNFLDINQAPDGKSLNKGFFAQWHKQVGGKTTFSISKATEVFEEFLNKESNISLLRNVELLSVNNEQGKIKSIIIKDQNTVKVIQAAYFIDASQDADLAVMADVPYFKGGADIGLPERHMAATLVIHIGNVDWQELSRDVRTNKFGPSYINNDNAWGFVKIGQLYEPVDKQTKLRGLNIVIEDQGLKSEVYINALLVFDFEPSNLESLNIAYERGKREAEHVLDFLKENLAGFKDARLLSFPSELYIRESRHIIAEYQLQVRDLLNNRIPEDTIALASYPLDYQASTPEYEGFVLFNPAVYGVPLRSLIPVGSENILVVGRSAGYSSLAAASARVLPTGVSTGEAAGLVVSYLLNEKISISELLTNLRIMEDIQNQLKISKDITYYKDYIGKNLILKNQTVEELFPGIYNSNERSTELIENLEYLLSWGLLIGGYNNDFKLTEEISERDFSQMIIKGLKQQEAPILYEWVPGGLESMSSNEPLTRDQAAMLLIVAISRPIYELSQSEYFSKAIEYNLIPEIISSNIRENRILNRGEAYILISSFLQEYPLSERLRFYRGE